MKSVIFFVLNFIFILNSIFSSENFTFNFKNTGIINISIRANYRMYVNKKYEGLHSKEYKAILTVDPSSDKLNFNGNLIKFDKVIRNGNYYGNQIENIESTIFKMNRSGEIEYDETKNFPIIQNLPYFPEKEIKINDPYYNYGKLVLNIFSDKKPLILPIKIATVYTGKKELMGTEYDYFNVSFSYNNVSELYDSVKSANGNHNIKLYFDSNSGLPYYIEDHFTDEFIIDKNTIKRSGFYLIFYKIVKPMDKDKILNDLTDDIIITKKEKDEIKFEKKKQGISITLENLLFKVNSDELFEQEYEKLDKIYQILSRVKERSFMVIGHTALSGTYEEQMKLSLDRAKRVAEYLIYKGIESSKVLYTGKGALEPVAPNDTEENMKKNRRVEIIILED